MNAFLAVLTSTLAAWWLDMPPGGPPPQSGLNALARTSGAASACPAGLPSGIFVTVYRGSQPPGTATTSIRELARGPWGPHTPDATALADWLRGEGALGADSAVVEMGLWSVSNGSDPLVRMAPSGAGFALSHAGTRQGVAVAFARVDSLGEEAAPVAGLLREGDVLAVGVSIREGWFVIAAYVPPFDVLGTIPAQRDSLQSAKRRFFATIRAMQQGRRSTFEMRDPSRAVSAVLAKAVDRVAADSASAKTQD